MSRPPFLGWCNRSSFESGEKVTQGQTLVQLDADVERANLASAQASLKLAKADLARGQSLRSGRQHLEGHAGTAPVAIRGRLGRGGGTRGPDREEGHQRALRPASSASARSMSASISIAGNRDRQRPGPQQDAGQFQRLAERARRISRSVSRSACPPTLIRSPPSTAPSPPLNRW